MWILIILMVGASAGAVAATEFSSKEKCQIAIESLKQANYRHTVTYVCVQK